MFSTMNSMVGAMMAAQVPSGEGLVAPAAGSVGQPSAPPGMVSAIETHLSPGFTLSQGSADSVTDGSKS